MVTLQSDRLTIRPWKEQDVTFVFDLYSSWDVQRFLGHAPSVMQDVEEAETLLFRLRQVDDPLLGYWAVELVDGTVVGTVMLQGIRLSGTTVRSNEVEIGWHFHPDHWGRGYAVEAASRLLQHALSGEIDRVIAVTFQDNAPSERVCQRIGMKYLGKTSRYYDAEYSLFEASR